jgi:hypothetical protein
MITEFFHSNPRAEAFGRLNEIMKSGTVRLIGAVCYVTHDGCALLKANIERFKSPGSFFIAGYNEISSIGAINDLCRQAPGKFYFHGIAKKGSEAPEGHFQPGLMHDKLIYAEGESEATVWVGSHNLTHNGLLGVNIESATITTGDKDDPFFREVRLHLESGRRESFEGPAPIPKDPPLDKPIRDLVIVHCEATEEQIQAIREEKNCYMSIHLRQDSYDSLCRPPADPDKHVRLHLYLPGELDSKGPRAPARLVKAGELYGVNFTEKSVRKGNTAGWPEMSFCIEEPHGDDFQPLRICSGAHDRTDDVTVCAIRVDDTLEEIDESNKNCILAERPSSEVEFKGRRLNLSPLEGDKKIRYVMLIESLRAVAKLSGSSPIAGETKMEQIYEERGEEVVFDRDPKKPFRFIHNGKLFALPIKPESKNQEQDEEA